MSVAVPESDIRDQTDIDTLTGSSKAPVCEALPKGHSCYRQAKYTALITPHGCRRDGKRLLLCQQCYDTIKGGSICAICGDTIIHIVKAVSL